MNGELVVAANAVTAAVLQGDHAGAVALLEALPPDEALTVAYGAVCALAQTLRTSLPPQALGAAIHAAQTYARELAAEQ